MWQRVQTLWLFLATVITASLFFCNKTEGVSYISYVPYLVLLIVVTLLNILALTTYKHRIFQMRTAVLSALITLGLQGWIAVDYFVTNGAGHLFNVTAVLPFVSIIFLILAARAIFGDEMMVRSSDRLRAAKRKKTTK